MLVILITLLVLLGIILMIIYNTEYRLRKISSPDGTIKEYWAGSERRRAVRLEIPLPVKYTAIPPHNHNSQSVTRNISKGGIQMLIYEKLNVGDIINLELKLDNKSEPITGQGQIVWLQDAPSESAKEGKRVFISGIKFIDLNSKNEQKVSDFIYTNCCLSTDR